MKDAVKYEGATLFRSERIEPFNLAPGVRTAPILGKHRAGANDQVGIYLNRIEPGCSTQREVHPEVQETIVVVSGTAKVGIGVWERSDPEDHQKLAFRENATIQLVQGDVLAIEPGTVHELRNDARLVPFVYFCVASPPF